MRWTRQVTIDGDPDTVYGLVADIERWPRLLPHVRATCSVSHGDGDASAVARIGYERFGFLVSCTCRVMRDARQRRVGLLHLAGLSRGISERWSVEPLDDDRVRLVYECAVRPGASLRQRAAARWLALPLAERALPMIDLLAEADRLAHRGPISSTIDSADLS